MNFHDKKDDFLVDKIKKMNYTELNVFAQEVRNKIIEVVSKNGGHLSSNLGVVELTIALYRVFDPRENVILWDTGHQCYTHKILTGRNEAFNTIRTFNGLSGFVNLSESKYDRFGTGHVGTAIAAGLGIEKALSLNGEKT
jgi:1-deoxy-D-xylulose-5-phosphate synthase